MDHYESAYEHRDDIEINQVAQETTTTSTLTAKPPSDNPLPALTSQGSSSAEAAPTAVTIDELRKPVLEPEERFLAPTAGLSVYHSRRMRGLILYFLLQKVTRDGISHQSPHLRAVHGKAPHYDNRIEHLFWTYAQVASAIMMFTTHGSNNVANAVGLWVAAYDTYITGEVSEDNITPA